MRTPLAIAAALLALPAVAAEPPQLVSPFYVPIVVAYQDGKYVDLVPVSKVPRGTISECLEVVAEAIKFGKSKVALPAGAAVLGACLAVPAVLKGTSST